MKKIAKDIESDYLEKVKKLKKYNNYYYNDDNPKVSDYILIHNKTLT